MKRFVPVLMPLLLLSRAPGLRAEDAPVQPITLSVRDADWKDVLRAALENTNLNLSFDPDLDTRVQGLNLKGVSVQELLDEILPGYGLTYTRNGRSIHVMKSDGGLRFYQVDNLSMRRVGSKDFTANASGQVVQTGSGSGGGGAQGHSSAYTSTLQTGNSSDPWQDLQVGLSTLIFGESVPASADTAVAKGGPGSSSLHKDGKTLMINPGSGLVTVAADAATHRQVERFLGELQRRSRRQVLLEARIVEVTLGNDSQMGVDWSAVLSPGVGTGGPGTSLKGSLETGVTYNSNLDTSAGLFKLIASNARVTATLAALARDNKLTVLSSPRLTALNNQKAILRVVREEAFFLLSSTTSPGGTTSAGGTSSGYITTVNITPMVVPAGIILDILPQVGDDGTITLAVNPSVSEIVDVRTAGSDALGAKATMPVVDRRDLDTVVRIQSGETLVLAGIIKTKDSTDDRGVPWLRRLPILGSLFTKNEKSQIRTELAIFITPTLMEDSAQMATQRKEAERRLDKAGLDPHPAEPKPVAGILVP